MTPTTGTMPIIPKGELQLVEIPTKDNGIEVLWAENGAGRVRLVSVPVFAFGVSSGTTINTELSGHRLRFKSVLTASTGATIRCYVAAGLKASEVYVNRLAPDAKRRGLRIGPATLFDPEIAAVHIATREQLQDVAACFNSLVHEGTLRFWELGDPSSEQPALLSEESLGEPWELIHPLPVEGSITQAYMH
ncbi:MAG TPA: DUF4265 domain-containing protein [Gemmatimonadaceae bacterium]|jgi:hypothetical protein|nr:DUF4265 domain-containing protein [Gemmatimonadaceae bacterium]